MAGRPTTPKNERRVLMMASIPLAEAREDLRLGVSGSVPPMVVYYEDRLMGPNKLPASMLVGNMRAVLSDSGNQRGRTALCEYIATEFFPKPVHPRRWPAVLRAARERAEENGRTARAEVLTSTMQALALIRPSDVVSSPRNPFDRIVARHVNKVVTEDFLGLDWRRRITRLDDRRLDSDEYGFTESQALEAVYGCELLVKAKLTLTEAAVLTAVAEGKPVEEWAKERGIKGSGARTTLGKARRKIREVAGGESNPA
jgi:hypothetical protein